MKSFFTNSKIQSPALYRGLWISFSGSISPGLITLGVLQLYMRSGYFQAAAFSLGAVSMESVFVWLSLVATRRLSRKRDWIRVLEWVSLTVLTTMTIVAGKTAFFGELDTESEVVWMPPGFNAFGSGIVLRMLMPTFIPFWTGWNTLIVAERLIPPTAAAFRRFTVGTALGTFTAHHLFIVAALLANHWIEYLKKTFNYIIFIVLCFMIIYTLMRRSKRFFHTNLTSFFANTRIFKRTL